MEITIHKGLSTCKNADGINVVIDVFRATTTIPCLLFNSRRVLIIQDISELEKLANDPNYVCFSEISGSPKVNDNSPLLALRTSIDNKIPAILTKNGTKAIHAFSGVSMIITASFVNMDAVVSYLLKLQPEKISLVAVGRIAKNENAIEDILCAETIKTRLLGGSVDETSVRGMLSQEIRRRNKDSSCPQGKGVEADLAFCRAIGILDIVPRIYRSGGYYFAEPVFLDYGFPYL